MWEICMDRDTFNFYKVQTLGGGGGRAECRSLGEKHRAQGRGHPEAGAVVRVGAPVQQGNPGAWSDTPYGLAVTLRFSPTPES